jgi:hypothetical protein
MRQAAPGRYVGSFPAEGTGSYFVNVVPGPGATPLTTGVTVPYSSEYRVRQTNRALIDSLAAIKPSGGEAGQVTVPLGSTVSEELVDTNPFRGGLALARSIRDAWPWFVLAGCCLFFTDVMVRRVAVNFDWVGRGLSRLRGDVREKDTVATARLDALKKNKEAVDDSIEKRRASVRFEPTTSIDKESEQVDLSDMTPLKQAKPVKSDKTDSDAAGPSYTERLLEAKRRAKKKDD